MSNFFYLLIPIIFSISASAQDLTLRSAIGEGLGQSPKILAAQSKASEAHYKKIEGLKDFLPTLYVTGTDVTQQNYMYQDVLMAGAATPVSFPQIVPSYLFAVNMQWPIFDGFASTNRWKSASAFEDAAENESEWTKFKTEKEITLQFYRALGAQVLNDVSKQNLTTLEDHLRDVQLFKKAGVSTNYDVLRVEVQVNEARSEVLNTSDNTEIARNRLWEVLGKESDSRNIVGEFPALDTSMIAGIEKQVSLNQRKDLRGVQQRVEGYERLETAKGRYWLPMVSAFGTYNYYNNRNTSFPDNWAFRDSYMVGLTMTWGIFDGMASYARSKQAVEQRYQAEKDFQISKIHASQDLELWKRKFIYYCSLYKSRVNDVEKSTESVRLARQGRKVGARTNTELLDAESELFRSKAGAVNAQIGAIEALINLELTTGRRLLP